MNKNVLLFLLFIMSITLIGCFDVVYHENLVVYDKQEVLEIAKEKYQIGKFYFINYELYHEIPFEVNNSNNYEMAITSFVGVNGGHDIQGMYANFICYLAYGIDDNGNHKFIYYNTNLDKNEEIADTIGASDYPYSCNFEDIASSIDTINYPRLRDKLSFLKNLNPSSDVTYLIDEKLTLRFQVKGLVPNCTSFQMTFDKNNGKTIFDIYCFNRNEAQLYFSTNPNSTLAIITDDNYQEYLPLSFEITVKNNPYDKYYYFLVTITLDNKDYSFLNLYMNINLNVTLIIDGQEEKVVVNWDPNYYQYGDDSFIINYYSDKTYHALAYEVKEFHWAVDKISGCLK